MRDLRSASCVVFGGIVTTTLMTVGCGKPTFGDAFVRVTVTVENAVARPNDPAALLVTARNIHDEPIIWGMGSSSCQLSLEVRVDGGHRRGLTLGGCTTDYVEQGLDPGETRTERLVWGGGVVGQDETVAQLPAGEYEVRGAAGEAFRSAGVRITVTAPTLQST